MWRLTTRYRVEKTKKKRCFPSLLNDRTVRTLQLSWWWIPLLGRIWQVFVVNIVLSASPVGSLRMQIPVAAVFYDTCPCSPGRPRQEYNRGLANQDRKRGMGRQVACSAVSVVSCLPSASPSLYLPITALSFVLPSFIFIAPPPPPCLSVRRGHRTPPLLHTVSFLH